MSTCDIWEQILQRHWTFLETDDGMQKIDERKKLEACLHKFLCIVPHDRKFFLPETAQVLKKSILEVDEFTAYKAMIGFESISQYANNLFTKPWRKEFKVIKMYSGFYQHEIKSNLIDAEKLFKAMGYRQLPNQLLVLDGPICPDQVTNVSRDGMAAYVECQIMKNILNGLDALNIKCTWLDIFNFRQAHICGQSQAIKSMGYAIQEKRFRKEKQLDQENYYTSAQQQQQQSQHQSFPQQSLNCPTCYTASTTRNYRQTMQQLNGTNNISPCQIHGMNGIPMLLSNNSQDIQKYDTMCSVHSKSIQQPPPAPPPLPPHQLPPLQHHDDNIYNVPPMQQMNNCVHGYSQMSHSKSLEHYAEPSAHVHPNIILTRHSFDHYDCVDSSMIAHNHQNCSYNSYNQHPYNVSGNRYPLPYNISNQLSNNQSTIYGQYQPQNNSIINSYQSAQKIMPINDRYNEYHCMSGNNSMATTATKLNGGTTGNNYQEHIDLNCSLHQNRLNNGSISVSTKPRSSSYLLPNTTSVATATPINEHMLDLYNRNTDYNNVDHLIDEQWNQQQPIKRNNRVGDDYSMEQNQKIYDNNCSKQLLKNSTSKMKGQHENLLLLNDHNNQIIENTTFNSSSNDSTTSTTKSTQLSSQNKNQDGFGSFESWNYVFQNLEKNGYTKDLGERDDLLVQGLDLDSIKLNNEKRKSREIPPPSSTTTTTTTTTVVNQANSFLATTTTAAASSPILTNSSIDQDNVVIRKLSKNNDKNYYDQKPQSTTTTTTLNNIKKVDKQQQIGKSNGHISCGKNRDITTGGGGGNIEMKSSKANNKVNRLDKTKTIKNNAINNNDINTRTTESSTIDKSKHDWSCRFCTFLNSDSVRICEMCSKTKDFVLDSKN